MCGVIVVDAESIGLLVSDVMPICMIIALDIIMTLRGSINCSTVIRSPTVYLLSWEKPLVNTTAPGSIHTYRFHFRFYFALLLCCFQFSLGKQSIRDWQPLHSVGSKLFVFVQALVILLHWIDTLVLKLREILTTAVLHHPFRFEGTPTQGSKATGEILCIFA